MLVFHKIYQINENAVFISLLKIKEASFRSFYIFFLFLYIDLELISLHGLVIQTNNNRQIILDSFLEA